MDERFRLQDRRVHMFVASEFKDVRFEVELSDPDGKALPVPRPAHEVRITHCAKKSGKHTLKVKPSTPDHYATVTVDCPRHGPEGLKRADSAAGDVKPGVSSTR